MANNNIIAFQGVKGAHSDLACRQAYPYMETIAKRTFDDTFKAVESGEAALGMIPIENTYAGRVPEIHNLLANTNLHIVGEHFQKVEHHLLAPKGTKLEDIKLVHSHPQALMQCRETLLKLGLETKQALNTAAAAKEIAENNDGTQAALASELAGELYGLEVIKPNCQDAENNMTVFLLMGKEPIDPDPEKGEVVTTLLFTIRNIPAALYKSLGGFATNNVNMLKLESYIPGGTSDMAQFFISFRDTLTSALYALHWKNLASSLRKYRYWACTMPTRSGLNKCKN